MYRKPLVPDDFKVPKILEADELLLRPLTVDDGELDYQVLKSCVNDEGKPDAPKKLTRKQHLIDLGWHEKEFQKRSSFAYTVLSSDGKKCLGCVYIYPSTKMGYDAEVSMWVTDEAYKAGLPVVLRKKVKNWIDSDWPFVKVYYSRN
jgi:hypothetical protein